MYCLMTINTFHTSFTYVADLTNLIDIKTYNNHTLRSLFNVFGNKPILDLRLKQKVSIIWVKNVVRNIPRFFISRSLSSVRVIIEFIFIKTYNITYHIYMAVWYFGKDNRIWFIQESFIIIQIVFQTALLLLLYWQQKRNRTITILLQLLYKTHKKLIFLTKIGSVSVG